VLLYGAENVRQAEALLDGSERFFGLETFFLPCHSTIRKIFVAM
jgi:hypothetical protein